MKHKFWNIIGVVAVLIAILVAYQTSKEKKMSAGIKTENISVDFKEGDMIAVIAGVWKDTVGAVQRMDYGKQTATINVELFGRETPVEISFAEIKKM